MELGSSQHWSDTLFAMTGEREISTYGLLEFFQPLYIFLKNENDKREMSEILDQYNTEASIYCNRLVLADWAVTTDLLSDEKQQQFIEAIQANADFLKSQHSLYFESISLDDFTDEGIRRQLKYLKNLGTDALSSDRLRDLRETNTAMENIYNTAKICPFDDQNCNLSSDGWSLNPGKTLNF